MLGYHKLGPQAIATFKTITNNKSNLKYIQTNKISATISKSMLF